VYAQGTSGGLYAGLKFAINMHEVYREQIGLEQREARALVGLYIAQPAGHSYSIRYSISMHCTRGGCIVYVACCIVACYPCGLANMRSPEGVWLFYIEFLTETMQISVSILFFIILYTYYGLPVHMVRSVQTRPAGRFRRVRSALCAIGWPSLYRMCRPLCRSAHATCLCAAAADRRRPLRNSAVPFE
jgi:hypothetical protein